VSESAPCTGCGYCCTEVICAAGRMIYGHYARPCPSLVRKRDRYVCSLYLNDPLRYGEILEIGRGCCSPLNPRRRAVVGGGRPRGNAPP
jgi:hypothetical protein